ncbi:hypothetical protein C0991_009728, partial [Blastosporella zonata]
MSQLHTQAPDSPIRASRPATATLNKMPVSHIAEINKLSARNTLLLVETEAFVRTLLSHADISTTHMLSDLKTKGLYIRERWAGFPQNKEKEKSFYTPFADTANAIVRSIPGNDTVKTNMLYLDIHDVTPHSQNPQTPIGRPDGAAATVNTKVMAVNEEIKKLERIIQGTGVTGAAKKKAKSQLTKQNSEMKNLMKGYELSWMGIHVPYEIKPSKSQKDWHGAVDQAMTYIGHVFMEQLDRRFAFALVLCRDELTILMCDRSGLMVTKTPINIHK